MPSLQFFAFNNSIVDTKTRKDSTPRKPHNGFLLHNVNEPSAFHFTLAAFSPSPCRWGEGNSSCDPRSPPLSWETTRGGNVSWDCELSQLQHNDTLCQRAGSNFLIGGWPANERNLPACWRWIASCFCKQFATRLAAPEPCSACHVARGQSSDLLWLYRCNFSHEI